MVEMYRSQPEEDEKCNPLTWWKKNNLAYPNIAKLAKQYLACPCSSVPSERLFSAAGNIVSKKRASLSRDTADMLVCLSSWLD